MKHQIKQLIEQVIFDNRENIVENGGNIKQYLDECFEAECEGQFWYLTDEESQAWDSSKEQREILTKEIYNLHAQYDYIIKKID